MLVPTETVKQQMIQSPKQLANLQTVCTCTHARTPVKMGTVVLYIEAAYQEEEFVGVDGNPYS
jgi:hypothetical protein